MALIITVGGLAAGVILWLYGFWREKKKILGQVSLVSPFTIQFIGLILALVMAANLFALLTGIEWQSPFMR